MLKMGGSIDDKVKSNSIAEARKEISAAVSKQYENKAIELKREPNYFENKKIDTDGANEHNYAQEKSIKVDYNKLFDYLGSGSKGKNLEAEAGENKKAFAEERKGEMSVEELRKFVAGRMTEAVLHSGERAAPEELERVDAAMVFNKVWLDYELATAPIRTRDFNFNKYNLN